eukprot:TRINITY_DN7925_c1_g1_i1.p1 TRINITY_DN7925_c1_g1~~TRINITY_DN7925_c1_g1_i1.p1  ORF type:complete len:231 (-),score=133.25 TRINITY_DN7925_c1_g1_i1:112-804(-)
MSGNNGEVAKNMNLLFIGPPGAGKGTQASLLRAKYGICHLATGDLLRDAIANQSELGRRAKPIMDAGNLVPDELMLGLVEENLETPECKNGFILDGYPRNFSQAESLDKMLQKRGESITKAFAFNVDEEELVTRVTGRLIHLASGRVYHKTVHPPKVAGKDDITGEPLTQRSDDNEQTLRKRLSVYRQFSQPLCAHYRQFGILTDLEAMKSAKDVHQIIISELKKSGFNV